MLFFILYFKFTGFLFIVLGLASKARCLGGRGKQSPAVKRDGVLKCMWGTEGKWEEGRLEEETYGAMRVLYVNPFPTKNKNFELVFQNAGA